MSGENGDSGLDSGSTEQVVATAQGAVEAVRTASETVDEELTSIDERTSTQATEMESVVGDISSLSATIEEVTARADEVATRSEQAATEVEAGYETAAESLDVMEEVTDIGAAAADDVERLEAQLDRIEASLSGIDDIADQTNILALNASIEAARADVDGAGFAVVADEIKTLAEQSQQQADEVETLLEDVRSVATETIDRLNRAIDALETGADRTEETMESLGEVADAVDQTAADVQSVSEATADQAETTEAIAHRCENAADRADSIETDVASIRDARAEQTDMLREIEGALATVGADTARDDGPTLSTGLPAVDDHGGLREGGRSVLTYDGDTAVDEVVAGLCGTALAEGYAVSLTPTPTLDRDTLDGALEGTDGAPTVRTALAEDRLFVLDAFDTWRRHRNVFDLTATGLGAANERTDDRRDRPLLVVGNIAAEIAVMGEAEARAARYENDDDDGVLGERDTVLNVIDETTVEDSFAAFYVGAADQVVEVRHEHGRQRVELVDSTRGGRSGRSSAADD